MIENCSGVATSCSVRKLSTDSTSARALAPPIPSSGGYALVDVPTKNLSTVPVANVFEKAPCKVLLKGASDVVVSCTSLLTVVTGNPPPPDCETSKKLR